MMREGLNKGVIWLTLLLTGLLLFGPLPCRAQASVWDSFPDEVLRQFRTGPISQGYSLDERINPFYLRGDFDGDGHPDYAILVVAKKNQFRGCVIWLSSQKRFFVLGAGQQFKFGAKESKDFDELNFWQVYPRKAVQRGVEAGPPPKLKGEAILTGKAESASGLIYWNGRRFLWYQQGD